MIVQPVVEPMDRFAALILYYVSVLRTLQSSFHDFSILSNHFYHLSTNLRWQIRRKIDVVAFLSSVQYSSHHWKLLSRQCYTQLGTGCSDNILLKRGAPQTMNLNINIKMGSSDRYQIFIISSNY